MAEKVDWKRIEKDRDEPITVPLDSEEALRGFLAVDSESEPADAGETEEEPARRRTN
jgi:hypothetical protein